MPTADFINRFYSTGMYRGLYRGFLRANEEFVSISHSLEHAGMEIDFIRLNTEIALPSNARVLDFGCSEGTFLKELKRRNPKFSVYGIEPGTHFSKFNKENMAGLYENIDDIPSDIQFDLITTWHVLEHLRDPVSALAKLQKKLKENGFMVIEVPNLDGYIHGVRRFHIGHLYYFSKDTIKKILEMSGFTVVQTFNPDNFNMRIIAKKQINS